MHVVFGVKVLTHTVLVHVAGVLSQHDGGYCSCIHYGKSCNLSLIAGRIAELVAGIRKVVVEMHTHWM